MRGLLLLSFAACLTLPAAPAASGQKPKVDAAMAKKVDDLFQEWKDLRSNQDVRQQRRRREIARALGDYPIPHCTDDLLKILNGDNDERVEVAALLSLGKVGGLPAVRKMSLFVISRLHKANSVLGDYLGLALAKSKDPEVGRFIVQHLLTIGDRGLRVGCIEALGDLHAQAGHDILLRFAKQEMAKRTPHLAMLYESLRALGKIGGAGARDLLLQASQSADWRIREAPAEVLLIHDRDKDSLAAMHKLLHDPRPIVREVAAQAVGRNKVEALFPDLIVVMEEGNLRSKKRAYEAMKELTGKDFGYAPEVWRKWWGDKQAGRLDKKGNLPTKETISVATYYNFKVFSDRLLFIVDVSGSMKWPRFPPHRIDVAKRELLKVLKSLKEKTLFNVMVFSGATQTWQKHEVPATPMNIADAIRWSKDRLLPGGGTNTYDALKKGIQNNPKIDTIYFLSDGVPSTGKYIEPDQILIKLRDINRFRKVTVNTIGLAFGRPAIQSAEKYEDPEEMAEFMSRLAGENGGKCLNFRKPPKGD